MMFVCLFVSQHFNIWLNFKTTLTSTCTHFKLYAHAHIDKNSQIRLCSVTLTAQRSGYTVRHGFTLYFIITKG